MILFDRAIVGLIASRLAGETMERVGAILAGRRWYDLARERWKPR